MRINRRTTKAQLEARIAALEAQLAAAEQRIRSLAVLLERAEEDRNRALGRLASAVAENKAFRHQLMLARADAPLDLRTGG